MPFHYCLQPRGGWKAGGGVHSPSGRASMSSAHHACVDADRPDGAVVILTDMFAGTHTHSAVFFVDVVRHPKLEPPPSLRVGARERASSRPKSVHQHGGLHIRRNRWMGEVAAAPAQEGKEGERENNMFEAARTMIEASGRTGEPALRRVWWRAIAIQA